MAPDYSGGAPLSWATARVATRPACTQAHGRHADPIRNARHWRVRSTGQGPAMFNRTIAFILVAALAAGLGLWAAQRWTGHRAAPGPQLQAVKLFDAPRVLPAFSLQQSDGTPLVPGELKGHWTLVFLGFTHCPDVCPTTLAQLAQAQKQWAALPEPTRPRVLFVSVDPERDTPDRIGEYAHAFHRDTLAATTDVPALEAFARSLSRVYA